MRNKILENAANLLETLGSDRLTKEEIVAEIFELHEIKLSSDQVGNLLSDLKELNWIEQTDDVYRIGFGLALVYKSARDAEMEEARRIIERLKLLTGEPKEIT